MPTATAYHAKSRRPVRQSAPERRQCPYCHRPLKEWQKTMCAVCDSKVRYENDRADAQGYQEVM